MYLDNLLSWHQHIDYLYGKLIKFTSLFYKLRAIVPYSCLKMLYFSFIHPHLLYGIEIYANTDQTYLNKLCILNNKLIRILFSKSKFTHVCELYTCVNSLPINKLHEFQILCFVHKCLFSNECMPNVFDNYFQQSKLAVNYSSRYKNNLFIRSVNNTYGKKCISVNGSILWNNLPENFKSINSLVLFKKSLKKYLLSQSNQ